MYMMILENNIDGRMAHTTKGSTQVVVAFYSYIHWKIKFKVWTVMHTLHI